MAKLGYFKISRELSTNSVIMAIFFNEFKPISFNLDISRDIYLMLCESERFREISPNEKIPFYDCEIKGGVPGTHVVSVEEYKTND